MSTSPARRGTASVRPRARASALAISLVATTAPTIVSLPVHAQDGAAAPASRLDAVTVTATRTPTRADRNLADLTVIDRAQIEQAVGRTLPELLAQQPGVQFAANGGLGTVSSVFLRGLDSRHTLLLVDGVRYGSATLGTPIWENLPLELIERIEIVRGPASGLYGTDAVGGVVQIFTRRGADGVHPSASATAGSDRYGQLGVGVRFGRGDFDGSANVLRTATRGFSAANEREPSGSFNPDRDGFRQTAGSLRLGWRVGGGWRLDAQALRSDGTARFDDGPGGDSRAALRSEVLSVVLGGPVNAAWRSQLRVARSRDDYEIVAANFAPPGTTGTVQRQFSWENTLATPLGSVLLLAERLEQDVSRPISKPTDAFAVSARHINAVAAGLNGSAGRHSWQANLRHDRNSQFGSHSTGTLAYGLALSPAWRVAASYGTSFVAPSFNLLYFPGFSNPNLRPEEGRHGEISLRWTGAGQTVRAAWFDNRVRNYIVSPAPTFVPVNAQRVRVDGVSLAWQAQLRDWTLGASAEHLDPRNVSENDAAAFGKQLPRRARNSAKAQADLTRGKWRFGATLVAFDERYDDTANKRRLGGYGTLDLRADWRPAPGWTLGLRLNNVANKTYETAYGYNQPGRQAFVTLRWQGS